MLQVFESERFLFDQMILSDREALEVNFRLFLASMLPPANNFPSIARENDMGGLEDCEDLRAWRGPGLVGAVAGDNRGDGLAAADIDGDLAIGAVIGTASHGSRDFIACRQAWRRAVLRKHDGRGIDHRDAPAAWREAKFIHARIGNDRGDHEAGRNFELYFDIDGSSRDFDNLAEKRIADTEFQTDAPK